MADNMLTPADCASAGPALTFPGSSPYEDYVHASVLASLQQPLSTAPEEMSFLVTTQVMELWLTLIVHEWRYAGGALVADDYEAAFAALRRSLGALLALNDSWRPVSTLTPRQFNGFRAAFGSASGFQSAMYRQMEFLLGDKSLSMVELHVRLPGYTRNSRSLCLSRRSTTRYCAT